MGAFFVRTGSPNIWNELWEENGLNASTGEIDNTRTNRIRSKNFISVEIDKTYYWFMVGNPIGNNLGWCYFYDNNQTFISRIACYTGISQTFSPPTNCAYIKFETVNGYGNIYKNNVIINISNPSINGTYYPYVPNSRMQIADSNFLRINYYGTMLWKDTSDYAKIPQACSISYFGNNIQTTPFIIQGTGTNNNTTSPSNSSLAKLLNKQGNSVVVNQIARPLNNTYWGGSSGTLSFNDGVVSFTATSQYGNFNGTISFIENHKYLILLEHKGTTGSFGVYTSKGVYFSTGLSNVNESNFVLHYAIADYNKEGGNASLIFQDNRASDWTEQQFKNICIIDLTQWFGSNDNIPADLLSHPENFFRYYQGSLAYNAGEIVNANSRYIKCIGRQQWDEITELGTINHSNGQAVSSSSILRCKNAIKVIPNSTYFAKSPYDLIVFYYENENYSSFISREGNVANNIFTIPSNCKYIRFSLNSDYGTTYNHDITISIYYEGESGYDQYYPYEILTNNDTGTETLRSAGSVKDYKTPDGTITRRVVSVDLSSLNWTASSGYYTTNDLVGIIKEPSADNVEPNMISNNYIAVARSSFDIEKPTIVVNSSSSGTHGRIYVSGSSSPTGTLYYERATPTTESGTAFITTKGR